MYEGGWLAITFTIPYFFLRSILAELRRQPYHVAVGELGQNALANGDTEILARSFRFVHEGSLRSLEGDQRPRFELGFVPFTLNRPQVWEAVAFIERMEGGLPATPTCSILLGSGEDVGLFTGIFPVRDRAEPVHEIKIVGPGMRRLPAVDFQTLQRHQVLPQDAARWSRLIGALGGLDVWQRLTSLNFCIIGTGRTGSLVATTLAKHGVHNLTLVDPDVLELHNLDAMDGVTERDLGRFKAQAIAKNLQQDLPHAHVEASPVSIITVEGRRPVKSADVLVCCVDDDASRLVIGGLASCYEKPLLDIGTGIFNGESNQRSALSPQSPATSQRRMGADVRLILPGDGCLLCWGGVANLPGALERLRSEIAVGRSVGQPRRPWHEERAGSLRSLNSIAAHLGIRLLEDLVASRLRRSVWLQLQSDENGIPSIRSLPASRHSGCNFCSLLGIGDLPTDES